MTSEGPRPTAQQTGVGDPILHDNETSRQRGLRVETYRLLDTLGEPSVEQRNVLAKMGFVLLNVEQRLLRDLLPGPEAGTNSSRIHISGESLLSIVRDQVVPGPFVVAVSPDRFRIPGSNNKTAGEQLELTANHSASEIESRIPGAKAIMLPASALVQLDNDFQRVTDKPRNIVHTNIPDYPLRNDGSELISSGGSSMFDVRALEGVYVGRTKHQYPLVVSSGLGRSANSSIWAAETVVFPRR